MPWPTAESLSVRSLCPFCGSSQDASGTICCDDWAVTTGATLQPPTPIVRPWDRVVEQGFAVANRLNGASQLLVVLLASSTVALLVSLGLQSRLAGTRSADVDEAHLLVPRANVPPPAAAVNEVPPPKPPEPARVVLQPASPAPVDSKSGVSVEGGAPAATVVAAVEPPKIDVAPPPPPPEPAPQRTGWNPEDLAKWHRLRRGMSRTAVRMIFGYPQWIDRRSTPRTEYWLYTSERIVDGGWIAFFDAEGPVSSWREP